MKFKIDCCTDIFTDKEIDILYQYGNFFYGLVNNQEPITNERRKLIVSLYQTIVIDNKDNFTKPSEEIESAWWKYCIRKQYEKSNPNWKQTANANYIQNDRKAWKEMRSQTSSINLDPNKFF
jgi:uncharacterized protein YifE (UPF0438 family)